MVVVVAEVVVVVVVMGVCGCEVSGTSGIATNIVVVVMGRRGDELGDVVVSLVVVVSQVVVASINQDNEMVIV